MCGCFALMPASPSNRPAASQQALALLLAPACSAPPTQPVSCAHRSETEVTLRSAVACAHHPRALHAKPAAVCQVGDDM